jgi:hypothetical protein
LAGVAMSIPLFLKCTNSSDTYRQNYKWCSSSPVPRTLRCAGWHKFYADSCEICA